ncbi:hypothetical protein E2C01_085800 [Portunus trituberculatus]|uniref:Uncharacterized protein n=1 Tax=Portunus trituberculatus TaxID=210409 RepID=A0A5B7J7P0_PORTR|nr:hypothetical protein [Portunus trituberculatus]
MEEGREPQGRTEEGGGSTVGGRRRHRDEVTWQEPRNARRTPRCLVSHPCCSISCTPQDLPDLISTPLITTHQSLLMTQKARQDNSYHRMPT